MRSARAFAQTEPDAGSDPGSMRTRAVRDGDEYVINGVKRFITDADEADFAQVMVSTDPSKGSHGGISCILVDMDNPGVKITAKYKTMMGYEPCEIVFDNCRVPAANMNRRRGRGFQAGTEMARHRPAQARRARHRRGSARHRDGHLSMPSSGSPSASRCPSGRPSSSSWRIPTPSSTRQPSWSTMRAWKYDRGEDMRTEGYMVKVYADEMSFRVVDRVLQIHGGIGLTTDLPLELWFRDQRSRLITEGASEVMRMVIARHVLRQYG